MYVYYADLDSPPTSIELGRISDEIADIWKRVGLELDLKLHKLNAIELNHPHFNKNASREMLFTWINAKINVSRRVLNKAIEYCRTNRGNTYSPFYNNYVHIYTLLAIIKGISIS